MQENSSEIIKVIGEHGEEVTMKLQEIVTVEDKDYALLTVVEEDSLPNDDEQDEVIIMRMIKTENDCTFEIIEDDEEFNMVVGAINDGDEFEEE